MTTESGTPTGQENSMEGVEKTPNSYFFINDDGEKIQIKIAFPNKKFVEEEMEDKDRWTAMRVIRPDGTDGEVLVLQNSEIQNSEAVGLNSTKNVVKFIEDYLRAKLVFVPVESMSKLGKFANEIFSNQTSKIDESFIIGTHYIIFN
jgi:hypothetical protein